MIFGHFLQQNKKKKKNERIMKDAVFRDAKTLF